MNEELDSQLSAMFDNELPPSECELLARRLSRDEQLMARWGRYAAIGAVIRAEGSVRLNVEVARRVSAAISSEPVMQEAPAPARRSVAARWWRPLAGSALAASVAAVTILYLRWQAPPEQLTAMQSDPAAVAAGRQAAQVRNASDVNGPSYVVPRVTARRAVVPSTQLANYVVAHSEFSSPVNRGHLLSALMTGESGAVGATVGSEEPVEDADDDAKSAK
jgi:sigma-E factor negative regulatory protein RseA